MSRDPIDKWLDAMQFEIFRLSPQHYAFRTELLESRIKQLESMPVTKEARTDLQQKLHQLKCLKQDLRFYRALEVSYEKMKQLKDQTRAGFLDRGQEACEVFNEIDTSIEKIKMEQRERQRQYLASLRQLWPNADNAKKRQMLKLFAIYSRRRLLIGTENILYAVPFALARWTVRNFKGRSGP